MAALNFPASPSGGQEYSANGKTWKWDGTSWKLKHVTSGATSFIGLSDTPSTFTANKWIKVNSGGNGLEWANAPTGGSGINLWDDQGGVGGNPQSLGSATGLLFNGDGVQANGADSNGRATITIPGGIQVQNDGTPLTTTCFQLNFRGAGVTASRTDATKWITIPGGLQVKDEGSAFTVNATVLDFKGTGVVVTEKSGTGGAEKVVTISSGGLANVVEDITPQLGGDLDLNGKDITGTGNINFTGVLTTRKDDVNSVVQTALKIGRSQNLDAFIVKADGNVTSLGVVESTGFKKTGGLSSQYLKADGSVSTLGTFTTTAAGLAPLTPGGTAKFLRADGNWAEPTAGGNAVADGNDYVISASLGTGTTAKVLTLGFTDTTKDKTVDLSSLSTTDTNTTYDISLVDGTDANTKKIRLSSTSPASIDEIIFKQGSYIQLIRSGEELEIKSVAALSGLVDVDYDGQSPTANKILKYSTTVNSGAGGWTLGDDNSGSNNTDTTYSISCADGDNADEEKIRLTAGGDGSGTDDIVLEAGSNMTVSRSGDKITFNSSFSDTDQLKNLSDTPNAYDNGKYLRSTATATEWASITQGVDKLKDLSDTPTGYDNGKYLKSTASGTEWASVTSGSSYTISAQDHGSDVKKKIIRLSDGTTNQDITIKADSYLSISRNGNEIELDSVAALSGLADVDYQGSSPTTNKILKYNASVNGGKWILADDETGGAADGNTTYSLEALLSPGIKLTGSDSTNDSVFFDAGTGITITRKTAPGASGGGEIEFACSTFTGTAVGLVPASTSGETTKFLKSDGSWDTAGGSITVFDETTELSTGATTLKFTGGMVSATGTDATKTITIAQPTLEIADGSTASQKKIKLGRGTDADDEIILSQGSYIQLNRSGQTLEIKSVQALSGLADVDYQGQSPDNNKILKYSTSTGGGKWILADDNTGSSADGNNYVSSASWSSSNGNLTLNRSGLSAITLGISNLRTYFDNRYTQGGLSISGTPTGTGSVIVWNGSTWVWSRTALINTGTSTNSTNFLVNAGTNSYSGVEVKANGELLCKRTSTDIEGGHLQFQNASGGNSFAVDVYRNTSGSSSVLRFIDQSTGTERFSVGPQGQWGIGHISRDYGDMGQVMISRGPTLSPVWGNHSGIAGAEAFATNAQGAKADVADAEIDHIYSQLNAIGNDDSITTVAQLKTALLALVRN